MPCRAERSGVEAEAPGRAGPSRRVSATAPALQQNDDRTQEDSVRLRPTPGRQSPPAAAAPGPRQGGAGRGPLGQDLGIRSCSPGLPAAATAAPRTSRRYAAHDMRQRTGPEQEGRASGFHLCSRRHGTEPHQTTPGWAASSPPAAPLRKVRVPPRVAARLEAVAAVAGSSPAQPRTAPHHVSSFLRDAGRAEPSGPRAAASSEGTGSRSPPAMGRWRGAWLYPTVAYQILSPAGGSAWPLPAIARIEPNEADGTQGKGREEDFDSPSAGSWSMAGGKGISTSSYRGRGSVVGHPLGSFVSSVELSPISFEVHVTTGCVP